MNSIELPGSGRRTTRIGFGCGRLVGGAGAKDSIALLEEAWNLGIRHYDLAPSYGLGLAENVAGRFFFDRRDAITLATKVGIGRPSGAGFKSAMRGILRPLLAGAPTIKRALAKQVNAQAGRRQFDIAQVQASFSESRKRLGMERVDILLLHEALSEDLTLPLAELFEQYQKDGLVDLYGSSTNNGRGELPSFGSISQFRWDIAEKPSTSRAGQIILHGVLRHGLSAIKMAIAAKSHSIREVSDKLNFDLKDESSHPALLLTAALAAVPDAIVLVSSSSAKRLRSCINNVDWFVAAGKNQEFLPTLSRFVEKNAEM